MEVLLYLSLIAGAVLAIASVIGLIVCRLRKQPKKRFLWFTLIIGILMAILPYALLIWAVITI